MDFFLEDLDYSEIDPSLSRNLSLLPVEKSHAVFAISAFLAASGKWDGAFFHRIGKEWIASGLGGTEALKEWLRSTLGSAARIDRSFERALKEADRLCGKEAIWAAELTTEPPPSQAHPDCPRLLFGRGATGPRRPQAAVFNSRRPRIVSPHESWLEALRAFLRRAAPDFGIASSIGAAAFDLVTACASHLEMEMLLTLPFPIESASASSIDILSPRPCPEPMIVSCATRAAHCSKAARMLCRDRIVAFLADFHLLLEIRSGGNLEAVLERQQKHDPRPQRILQPEQKRAQTAGSLHLIESFPQWSRPVRAQSSQAISGGLDEAEPPPEPLRIEREIPWSDYLYHYTRSRPGPWPGQTYREHLLSLFAGDVLAEHSSLDTLIRIVLEKRVRASNSTVRGADAVVCWSAGHPGEIDALRKWNRALIRWTFEPYGIAVKKSRLRQLGAKPAVYGKGDVYDRLRRSERYRFQKHEPPGCAWRHEREWRLPRDLLLSDIPTDDWIAFVSNPREAERLRSHLDAPVCVLALSESPLDSGASG